ncbi:hypothetical protein NLM59_09695 [Weeksellaceae bacterium KMM 9724]|uniref:hypothetical protein n=1 Tax=Profundicola chukchiensis TaxID=2961959 RepID=UPI00243CA358|nr:hypothetical protein [Profundicola chukchiensis]MDG4951201.1 hypothetical protein [Profundicola chukchiensis]
MKLSRLFLLTSVVGAGLVNAQESQCNNQTVIQLKEAGLSDEIIMSKVASEDCEFDTSTDALLHLKENNLSDEIISMMIQNNSNNSDDNEAFDYLTMAKVVEKDKKLLINNKVWLAKGDFVQIYLPAYGRDYYFVNKKQSKFGAKLIGGVADVVGTGAAAVGFGTNNIQVMSGAIKVMRGATAVRYGANALEKINDLDISKDAKRIAGKDAEVLGWDLTEDGYLVEVKIDKKKYEINLEQALTVKEINLIK